ncbi:ATP-binding protein [Burkholderia stabilis]|uniref:ATP-binding protein n=1 Tax=Burkholderia stabilis TaxID=95485 RepID=UPI001F4A4778|nr:ATP-binding protein [Burkholderia stabilis]
MNGPRERPDPPALRCRARFAARLDALADIGDWLRAACERDGVSGAWLDAFELAAIEAASNVIRHGVAALDDRLRADDTPAIALTLCVAAREVTLDLFDSGRPAPAGLFDARRSLPPVDPDDVEGLPEGGMGLGIMQASVDRIGCRRRLGINRLRLVKRRG